MSNYIVKIFNFSNVEIYNETIKAYNEKDALKRLLEEDIIIYDGDKITIDMED